MPGRSGAIRATYNHPAPHPHGRIVIARMDADTYDGSSDMRDTARTLAAQTVVMRDWRSVGEAQTHERVLEDITGNPSRRLYLANQTPALRLSGCMGYLLALRDVEDGTVRVIEGAVREAEGGLSERGQRFITGAMVLPLLEDYAPDPGNLQSLEQLDLAIASTEPTAQGVRTMGSLGLRHEGGFFRGEAHQVYAAIGELGLVRA